MNHSIPTDGSSNGPVDILIRALDSLTDGDLAVDGLIAWGQQAIGPLKEFLLHGSARTIALPRIRAARALGGLAARDVLLAYFENTELPHDPAVLFAEDAVRSTVACELMRWKDEETFRTLFLAATERATAGLIEALGEFARPEAIPLLFESLEDDLCRTAATAALLKMPEEACQYAVLSLRRETGTTLDGRGATRRRRSVAELLRELKVGTTYWQDVTGLLQDQDPSIVLCAASIGLRLAKEEEFPEIFRAIFRVAHRFNWLQEDDAIHLLDQHRTLACSVAKPILNDLVTQGRDVHWLSPIWRIFNHLFPPGSIRSTQ